MIKHSKSLALLVAIAFLALSCSESENSDPQVTQEYKRIQLMVSDAETQEVSFVNPASGSVQTLTAQYATSAVYPTGSGRYAALVHRAENLVEFIDTGIEFHIDHVDLYSDEAVFGSMTASGLLPTHFKSHYNQILVFNDGEGTLSTASESDINDESDMKIISFDGLSHHGAMTIFSNGNYSVTVKDNSIEGSLPERVKVIDSEGATLHESTIQTQGIHGSATNGEIALYGSVDGILVLSSSGTQSLIDYPADFGDAWIAGLLETYADDLFIGTASGKGLYLIDLSNESITPLMESTEIMKYAISPDETMLAALTYSGAISIYDLTTQTLVSQKSGIIAANEQSSGHGATLPNLALSSHFFYVSQPNSGEILQFSTESLSQTESFTVSSTPYSMALLGYEID